MTQPLRYHLRFQVIPGRNVARDTRALIKFCRAHGIEEVVLFFAAEEWNNGLLSAAEEDRWFDTVQRVKTALDREGIAVSLNPWMTALHCDRGRGFPPSRKFQPMVSPLGETSRACASFADPAWRAYLFNQYGRFARLGFRVLWVEDDFRYHNHSPLTWGGGFEPGVLERFARKLRRKTTREEVVRNILKPGAPHPWRAKWLETWRELQLEVAAGIAGAVARGAPGESRLGLMSSLPSTHSVEGRDWPRLFDALSIAGCVAHRPHFASYRDWVGRNLTYSFGMLDLQKNFRPAGCEVAPEIENGPFTRWTKSDSQSWAEMALSLFHGSDALLLDLFPFSANPADREPEVGELLDRSRPGLEWIAARFPKELTTEGVGAPWREDAQAHVRTATGRSLTELDATSLSPGDFLIPYGIPVSARLRPVNAVFGSLAWAFSDAEWRRILSGGLLLDAVSAEILCRRGFSRDVGVQFRRWAGREELNYSVERVARKEVGAPVGHCFNYNLLGRIALLEPDRNAQEWTTVLTPESRRVGAAVTAYRNRRGGRVVTMAAPNPAQLPRDFYRQRIIQSAVAFMSGGRFGSPTISGGPHLMPLHLTGPGRNILVIFNGCVDAARPVVRWPAGYPRPRRATLLAPLARPVRARMRLQDGMLCALTPVPYFGYMVLE